MISAWVLFGDRSQVASHKNEDLALKIVMLCSYYLLPICLTVIYWYSEFYFSPFPWRSWFCNIYKNKQTRWPDFLKMWNFITTVMQSQRRTLLRGDRVSFTSQTLLQTNQHSRKYRKYGKIQKSLHWLVFVLAFKTNLKKKLFLKMRMFNLSFRGLTHITWIVVSKGHT